MNSLAWIKSLYHHEPMAPRPLLRKLGVFISLIVGLTLFFTKQAWLPLVISLFLVLIFSQEKPSKAFISILGSGIFVIFHSMTLLCLIAIYYLMFTPLAVIMRRVQKDELFFMKAGSSTLRITDSQRRPNFERQF